MMLLLALLMLPLWQEAAPVSANIWQGREQAFEESLRTATVIRVEDLTLGVTRPRRAFVEPGGLVESFAWKPLLPGRRQGYWESYKSEIAAYELDKLLGLGMVPVVVERRVKGERGAAVLWLSGVYNWKEALARPKSPSWTRQMVRMKMFDNLIGNIDRNQGNLLVDQAGNVYLIDHSRAFVTDKKLPATLEHVDDELWQRMLKLDQATVKEKLGTWVGRGELNAMFQRRDRMQTMIDAIVAKLGDQAYVR